MKKALLALFIVSLFTAQAAVASNVGNISTFGLSDVVMADEVKAEGGDKKVEGKKKDEPDCE